MKELAAKTTAQNGMIANIMLFVIALYTGNHLALLMAIATQAVATVSMNLVLYSHAYDEVHELELATRYNTLGNFGSYGAYALFLFGVYSLDLAI